MSLQITEQNGTFYLNGRINTSTLNFFNTYFNYNLSQQKNIIVNIDRVVEIDKAGLESFRFFIKNAILSQKVFSIVGYGCKEIYDDFNQTNVA